MCAAKAVGKSVVNRLDGKRGKRPGHAHRDVLAAGRYVNDNATVGKTKKTNTHTHTATATTTTQTAKGATAGARAGAATAVAPQDAVVLMASPLHSSCEYKYPYSNLTPLLPSCTPL